MCHRTIKRHYRGPDSKYASLKRDCMMVINAAISVSGCTTNDELVVDPTQYVSLRNMGITKTLPTRPLLCNTPVIRMISFLKWQSTRQLGGEGLDGIAVVLSCYQRRKQVIYHQYQKHAKIQPLAMPCSQYLINLLLHM